MAAKSNGAALALQNIDEIKSILEAAQNEPPPSRRVSTSQLIAEVRDLIQHPDPGWTAKDITKKS